MSPDPMTLAPGARLGPYEIIDPLGAGGMGEVYRARDTRLGREVAVKVLPRHLSASPEVRSRFEREAKAISSLNHPHICALFDVGREGETDYLVMELVEGETLAKRLEQGPLAPRHVIRLGVEIADALAKAHRAGIVHRDLKPANVMVTRTGAKLMDFGLARATAGAGPTGSGSRDATALTMSPTVAAPLTAEGAIVGTFQYMAPEQLEGKEADARSDIWALGCLLYESLTGRRPFGGGSQASLISSIMKDEPTPPREIAVPTPAALDRIIRQCLAKDPEDRWQSAADLKRELEWSGQGEHGVGSDPGASPRRRGVPGAAVIAIVAAVALAAGLFAGRRFAAPPQVPQEEVNFRSLTYARQSIFISRFMPDGRTIVFSSVKHDNRIELFAIRPEYPEAQPLGALDTHLLDISKQGELAVLTHAEYVHHRQFTGTLARMPLGGAAPRELLEDVREASWGPDGESLAVIHLVEGEDRLEYPIGTVLYRTGGYLSDPRVSPDGERVAFMEHQNRWDDRGRVSVVDRSGSARPLTDIFWGEEGLAWEPDGGEILFSAGLNEFDVRAVDLAGRARTVLASAGGLILHDIAPDGRWLVSRDDWWSQVRGRGPDDTEEKEFSVLANCWGPTLSGDGRLVLFSDGSSSAGDNYAVTLRRTDGSPAVRLGEGDAADLSADGKWALAVIRSQPPRLVAYPTGAGQPIAIETPGVVEFDEPRWFPDGRRVLVCGHEKNRPSRCWAQALEGGTMTPVTPEGAYSGRVSSDGRLVAAWGAGKPPAIYPVDGGEARPVPGLDPEDRIVRWSPDGGSLLVSRGTDPARIERVNLADGRREPIREIAISEKNGLSKINGVTLADDPRWYAYQYTTNPSTLFLVKGAR